MAKLDPAVEEEPSVPNIVDDVAEPVFEEPIDDFFNTDF
jgi:hypothetical protein